jgi:hypothetical protein
MDDPYASFDDLSDEDLLCEVTRLAADERHATARLIASLTALDARRLYLTEGFSSLFEYCTDALRLSEHAAYDRITAARAARRFPVILDRLADGSVTLTIVRLLAPHLTDANHATLLAEAAHCSKRDVEHIVARLHPQPDAPLPYGSSLRPLLRLRQFPRRWPARHRTSRKRQSRRYRDRRASTFHSRHPESVPRLLPGAPLWRRSRLRATRSRSLSGRRLMRSSARCKTCCAMSCPTQIRLSSSTARSRHCTPS